MNESMKKAFVVRPSLLSVIFPKIDESFLYKLIIALAGTGLLTVSAKVQVPFYPIPMTMQTMVVLVIGIVSGWKLGGATVFLYLLEGAVGLPVFAGTPEKGIGVFYIIGPTGGYLLGFFFSAIVVGYLSERGFDRTFFFTLMTMFIGTLVIFLFGFAWLSHIVGIKKAYEFGVAPFILSEAFKIALATAILPICWKLTRKKNTYN